MGNQTIILWEILGIFGIFGGGYTFGVLLHNCGINCPFNSMINLLAMLIFHFLKKQGHGCLCCLSRKA